MPKRAVAIKMRCCRPTAYQRIEALRQRGDQVFTLPGPRSKGTTGPQAELYGIRG